MLMKQKTIDLLLSTKREGVDKLVEYLVDNGFFISPASTRFHGCYEGGLAKHSFNVYEILNEFDQKYQMECPSDSLVIAPLLHDVCKIGAYTGTQKPYSWNKLQPSGHAKLSVERIKKFITITELEEKMILYHMGIYGLVEFQDPGQEHKGEYTLRNESMANAWFHHPIVKFMYFSDEIATLKEKQEEK